MTDYELFRAFLDQTGAAHIDHETDFGIHVILFDGEQRGHKIDGHGRLEVTFEADGSLLDLCFWD